jgi:hypothetical protein
MQARLGFAEDESNPVDATGHKFDKASIESFRSSREAIEFEHELIAKRQRSSG